MRILFVLFALFLLSSELFGQVPAAEVKTLSGKNFNTSEISNDGKPIIISFWATWCKPCVQELSAIHEVYEDWVEETGVKLVAVAVDNSRSMRQVGPFVNGKAWDFDVLLDPNGDFKRAMNVINVPHTFVLDGEGKVVYEHTSYATGDEEKYFEAIQKISQQE